MSIFCNKFLTYDERVKQCDTSNLCSRCTSNKHSTTDCPGSNNSQHRPCKCPTYDESKTM